MAEFVYLSPAGTIALHALIMDRTGVAPAPLRNEAALESALARPEMAAHYEQADLVRQATVMSVGISQAQAFVDGNKRTAFIACDIFLRLNGLRFAGHPVEFARQLESVAAHRGSLEKATVRFETWLRERVTTR